MSPLLLLAKSIKQRPNVLLICVDDLRPELKCFGVDYIHSPNIDALAARGRAFHRHYVQAPTCGASRYTLLTGRYGPANNGALFQNFAKIKDTSFPGWFRKHGYTTVSVGKVSHHPGGRGGRNWDEDDKPEMPDVWTRHLLPAGPWQHPRGAMHGLANGEIRKNAKDMDVYQAFDGPDSVYPDGLITDEALKQMDTLAKAGAVFVEQTDEVPEGAIVVFSAHGVAPTVHVEAAERNLQTIDATCPLVTKVHNEAKRFARDDYDILLVGHEGHEEVVGTAGEAPDHVQVVDNPDAVDKVVVRDPDKVIWLSQTTLSVDETMETVRRLREKFPTLQDPPSDDICYATQNRQDAVRELAPKVELLLVVGAHYSSNSNRLRDLGAAMGIESHLIASADDMKPVWLDGVETVGITAGASAPEELVQGVIARLENFGEVNVIALSEVEENITFKLPRELLDSAISPTVT